MAIVQMCLAQINLKNLLFLVPSALNNRGLNPNQTSEKITSRSIPARILQYKCPKYIVFYGTSSTKQRL